jgi:DNA-binding SARP family transcriptional activator
VGIRKTRHYNPTTATRPAVVNAGRPAAVRIGVLGGFRVSVGSREIEAAAWPLGKAASLVQLLALAPDRRLHREQAMDLLWPEPGAESVANTLRQALHAARRALASEPTTGFTYPSPRGQSLVLGPESDLWVDAEVFEDAVAGGRRTGEPAAYRAAVNLYAGDLLPEDRYEPWAEERREICG